MRKPQNTASDVGVWQASSMLLTYPDSVLIEQLSLIDDAMSSLPARAAEPLSGVVAYCRATALTELQRRYVTTFDLRKKCCLYLSWWVHGDTRNRGYALVDFKAAYRNAGAMPPDDELPDHLAVVLEFAAQVDYRSGRDLLESHLPALELLRKALHDNKSPYAGVLDAVSTTLPPAGDEATATAHKIAAAGPPTELVGLEPYGSRAR